SDFFPTFCEMAGASLPKKVKIDGRSFAPQVLGQAGSPRDWAYVELGGRRYVRTKEWKLNESGELFDMREAPFVERLASPTSEGNEAAAARERLHGILVGLVGKKALEAQPEQPKAKAARRGAGRRTDISTSTVANRS